ncbi:hypothetical protein [Pseudomonas sp. zfem002]|uniref:hypothetical protein n=1 Tax=Pseudomonas sp. zfem002 TaxID=3078197 RepID=UPI002929CD82|nr:hypothetical protein [Pseudomonas sp. zfem002]MDU9393750.1 hypothetical protein [Pseudomonas sp. zfem002]
MRSDDDIYNDLGGVLLQVAPEGSCKIIMRAKLSKGLDSCECDCIHEGDNVSWFTAGGRANTDMLGLLIELRRWCFNNKPAGGLPLWGGCEVVLNLVGFGVIIDFICS